MIIIIAIYSTSTQQRPYCHYTPRINVWWLCLSLSKHERTSIYTMERSSKFSFSFFFLIIWVCLEKIKAPIHTQIPSAGSFITQGFHFLFRVWEGGSYDSFFFIFTKRDIIWIFFLLSGKLNYSQFLNISIDPWI